MSKHKKHIPKKDSFLNKVFSKEQSKEAYSDLEWEAKQGLDQLGEEEAIESLARIHKRIESQTRKQSKKIFVIPLWRYAAAAACTGILIVIGNQIINSTNNESPISYDVQPTKVQDRPSEEDLTPSTETIQETIADESMRDQTPFVEDDALNNPNQDLEIEAKDNANLPALPPPPAEPAILAEAVEEEIIFEEAASEEMVVLDLPNDRADNSSSQGSAVIEQEDTLPEAFMKDEMMPDMKYRSSEKNSLSTESMADLDVQEPVYDWSRVFAEQQFQEITRRFERSDWAEQHTNEDAMFFAARAYYTLGNLNKATAVMREVVRLNLEKAEQAKSYLEQWEK